MKHAHIVPLAGGAAIGCSIALKSNPEYLASWPAFAKNDSYAANYFKTEILNADNMKPKKVDIITCVPPCSGLSTATPSTSRGCQAPQNEHMLKVARYGMLSKADVVIIENAPTLYSPGGQEFANKFLPICKFFGYSMVLYKTSTILHGLPQNRIRSFVLLFRGKQIPKLEWIQKSYKPLHEWIPIDKSEFATKWVPDDDELLGVLQNHFEIKDRKKFLHTINDIFSGPVTGWKVWNSMSKQNVIEALIKKAPKYKFKTKPYRYMQTQQDAGEGIMDRSPYLVWDHCNALMWKSAHRMLNPAAAHRPFNIRELMNLMGMPKDYKEIPAKDINILFQNVPVTTVKTLVQEVVEALDGKRLWSKPELPITRFNNIKQIFE